MITEKMAILEQNTEAFETSFGKNTFICSKEKEWIGFADSCITTKEELCEIIEELSLDTDYDVILFGENVPDGACDFYQLLLCPANSIYAVCFKKSLLVNTGSYNRFLQRGSQYEFLLRLAEVGRVYSVLCSADSAEKEIGADPVTLAYIVRHYMTKLKKDGRLDEVFFRVVQTMEHLGLAEAFNSAMQRFLSNEDIYERVAADTAPWFILSGDETCFGVIADFADSLADALVKLGQAVIISSDKYGNYHKMSTQKLVSQCYKAIVGFQSPALEIEVFQQMKGRRLQFWFDNPLFFADFFKRASKESYILCQDAYYAEFIKKYYDIPYAWQFPPAGKIPEQVYEDKIYDVVFVGSYEMLPRMNYQDAAMKKFAEYMLQHPNATFESGMEGFLRESKEDSSQEEIMARLQRWQDVCFDVLQTERQRVIEAIVKAGISLHVFGDSWKNYQGAGKENLVLHPQVLGKEALEVWAKAKIGLNIMRGHRAGMTERIANIMLCGACCVTDETTYLQEHFRDGEDIVFYKRDEPEKIPHILRYFLEQDAQRDAVAQAGRKKALAEHTWQKRAEQLCELLEDGHINKDLVY